MQNESEVIALVMPDSEAGHPGRMPRAAQMLVRNAAGEMSLESVNMDTPLAQYAMATGCFRRGKPIFDPVSREVMGYEMEMMGSPLAAVG